MEKDKSTTKDPQNTHKCAASTCLFCSDLLNNLILNPLMILSLSSAVQSCVQSS